MARCNLIYGTQPGPMHIHVIVPETLYCTIHNCTLIDARSEITDRKCVFGMIEELEERFEQQLRDTWTR
jgi:hypothetical protein